MNGINLDSILIPKQYPVGIAMGLKDVDPRVVAMGFEIPDPATLSGEEAKYAQFLLDAVPKIDPSYCMQRDLASDINVWWSDPQAVDVLHLFGPTGTGKTSGFEQWCARLNVPLFSVKGHKNLESWEPFGHTTLVEGGKTEFLPGPLTLAAQFGVPCIINEYDRIQPSRAIVFNDVFEGRSFLMPGQAGKMLVPRKGFRVAVTSNTNLVEDPTGNYNTAYSSDTSLLERKYSVRVGYPPRDVERQIVVNVLSQFDDQLLTYMFEQEEIRIKTPAGMKEGAAVSREDFIEALLDITKIVRDQSKDSGNAKDNALERTISTRVLTKWARASLLNVRASEKRGVSCIHLALRKQLTNMATQSTALSIHAAVEQVLGIREEAELLAQSS